MLVTLEIPIILLRNIRNINVNKKFILVFDKNVIKSLTAQGKVSLLKYNLSARRNLIPTGF